MANVVATRGLLYTIAPGVLMLCVVVGAVLLWKRTRHASALVQLVAASLLVMDWAITGIYELASESNTWLGTRFWSEPFQTVRHFTVSVALVVFPIAYLWYAFTQKASNHAMERTSDRSAPHS
jgi:hypothetical protein